MEETKKKMNENLEKLMINLNNDEIEMVFSEILKEVSAKEKHNIIWRCVSHTFPTKVLNNYISLQLDITLN